jgi:hypothetical protein
MRKRLVSARLLRSDGIDRSRRIACLVVREWFRRVKVQAPAARALLIESGAIDLSAAGTGELNVRPLRIMLPT